MLETIPVERIKKDGERENRLELPMTIAFFSFIPVFLAVNFILPDNVIGVFFRFLLFPLLFLGMFVGAMFLFKGRVAEALTKGKERFVARAKALSLLAAELDLTYVPAPGGAPKVLKALARQTWAPAALKEATDVIDDHGGMDEALNIARSSGAMSSDVHVVGSPEQKEKYLAQQASMQQVEDGFYGTRHGVSFSAFEWIESQEDAPNIYHLTLVFKTPRTLYGVTQLRTRHIAWPSVDSALDLKPVRVVAPAFEDRFRMRSTDQVEARYLFDPVVIERVANLAAWRKSARCRV